ncbi:MAG: uracil-DNA glycosylase [Anaerolineae bacterium]|nr:uracil-DNA glycosylase [Anaerolineae bacterium]
MPKPRSLSSLNRIIITCTKCPRLVAYREQVARDKKRMYRDDEYWGKPVPGWGDPEARVYIVGLAPAAHGGNRTGRVFTGDSSGDFLFGALYRAGFANQPTSVARNDGLQLRDVYIGAAARCAPPDNKPTPQEFANCFPFLAREFELLKNARVLIGLGAIGFNAILKLLETHNIPLPRPRPKFGHNAKYHIGKYTVIGTYHPSRQNTNTGKLTVKMFDAVFENAKRELARRSE